MRRLDKYHLIGLIFYTVIFFPVSYHLFKDAGMAQRSMHLIVLIESLFLYVLTFNINLSKTKGILYIIGVSIILIIYSLNYLITFSVFSLNDFSDILRIIFIFNYMLIGKIVSNNVDFNRLLNNLQYLFKIQIWTSLLILLPPLYFILDIWKGRPSYQEFNFHFFRTSGTFIYPSDFSFVIGFFFFFYLYKYLTEKSNGKELLISIILIISSLSRGAILSYTLYLLLIPMLFYKTRFPFAKKIIKRIFFGSISIFPLLFYFLRSNVYVKYVLDSISYILSGKGEIDSSTLHRFTELKIAFNIANNNFPFGIGPSRKFVFSLIDTIESFYAYYLIKWGYLGIFLQLILYFFIIYFLFKKYLYVSKFFSNFNSIKALYFSFISITISFILFFGWSSAITERFKLMPFYFILVGYLISKKTIQINNQN